MHQNVYIESLTVTYRLFLLFFGVGIDLRFVLLPHVQVCENYQLTIDLYADHVKFVNLMHGFCI